MLKVSYINKYILQWTRGFYLPLGLLLCDFTFQIDVTLSVVQGFLLVDAGTIIVVHSLVTGMIWTDAFATNLGQVLEVLVVNNRLGRSLHLGLLLGLQEHLFEQTFKLVILSHLLLRLLVELAVDKVNSSRHAAELKAECRVLHLHCVLAVGGAGLSQVVEEAVGALDNQVLVPPLAGPGVGFQIFRVKGFLEEPMLLVQSREANNQVI